MSRIRKAYEALFRDALRALGARRVEPGVSWCLSRAAQLSAEKGVSPAEALTLAYGELRSRPGARGRAAADDGARFACDSGLGGLARWLRVAGYEATWEARIADDVLLRQAQATGSILLTTDSLMMERRLLRDGIVPSLWLPPSLSVPEQLRVVFSEFRLRRGTARCMMCGGRLRQVGKEALRHRIPPRTYLWLDTYFLCADCDRIYWHGTHWERIQRALDRVLEGGGSDPGLPGKL